MQDSVNFDGYDYETVQIGDRCWFAELRTVYANGDLILEVDRRGGIWAFHFGATLFIRGQCKQRGLLWPAVQLVCGGRCSGLVSCRLARSTDGEWTNGVENYNSGIAAAQKAIQLKAPLVGTTTAMARTILDFRPSGRLSQYQHWEFNSAGSLNIWWSSSFYDNRLSCVEPGLER